MLPMMRKSRTLTAFLHTSNLLYRNCLKQLTGLCMIFYITFLNYWSLLSLPIFDSFCFSVFFSIFSVIQLFRIGKGIVASHQESAIICLSTESLTSTRPTPRPAEICIKRSRWDYSTTRKLTAINFLLPAS